MRRRRRLRSPPVNGHIARSQRARLARADARAAVALRRRGDRGAVGRLGRCKVGIGRENRGLAKVKICFANNDTGSAVVCPGEGHLRIAQRFIAGLERRANPSPEEGRLNRNRRPLLNRPYGTCGVFALTPSDKSLGYSHSPLRGKIAFFNPSGLPGGSLGSLLKKAAQPNSLFPLPLRRQGRRSGRGKRAELKGSGVVVVNIKDSRPLFSFLFSAGIYLGWRYSYGWRRLWNPKYSLRRLSWRASPPSTWVGGILTVGGGYGTRNTACGA